ncbi:MAG TPA: sigma-70 family RNA polymerase sigma factor [Isosphaeraceae bacterium]|nr:sigma-70 family RNA polymerase sigma factor [Isosphaeraceae bacterium]
MSQTDAIPNRLLAQARAGDAAALGQLFELYRNYLRLIARSMLDGALRLKVDASDLVQETFLKAHRQFAGFAGRDEPELIAWLRQILVRTLADQARYHRRRSRNLRRQVSLEEMRENAAGAAQQALADSLPSPSSLAVRRERAVLLADALEKLPADYREVFVLRNIEHMPFNEIAVRMGRSSGATRVLWTRAMRRLGQLLEENEP